MIEYHLIWHFLTGWPNHTFLLSHILEVVVENIPFKPRKLDYVLIRLLHWKFKTSSKNLGLCGKRKHNQKIERIKHGFSVDASSSTKLSMWRRGCYHVCCTWANSSFYLNLVGSRRGLCIESVVSSGHMYNASGTLEGRGSVERVWSWLRLGGLSINFLRFLWPRWRLLNYTESYHVASLDDKLNFTQVYKWVLWTVSLRTENFTPNFLSDHPGLKLGSFNQTISGCSLSRRKDISCSDDCVSCEFVLFSSAYAFLYAVVLENQTESVKQSLKYINVNVCKKSALHLAAQTDIVE